MRLASACLVLICLRVQCEGLVTFLHPSSTFKLPHWFTRILSFARWRLPKIDLSPQCSLLQYEPTSLTKIQLVSEAWSRKQKHDESVDTYVASKDSLLILRTAFGSPKFLNILRSSQCAEHPALVRFDDPFRSSVSRVTNCNQRRCLDSSQSCNKWWRSRDL